MLELKEKTIKDLLSNKIKVFQVAEILCISTRTVKRYKKSYLAKGLSGLIDKRSSNYTKVTRRDEVDICRLKKEGPWRSARFIRDKLNLKVHENTVWNKLVKNGLNHLNSRRLKPIKRFRAKYPNQMWQTDIMGRIEFSKIGICYLMATLDDHSRFVLSAKWFKTQRKINVFNIWYNSLAGWGLPNSMLQDKGSQYKSVARYGQSDYQFYANSLNIKLIYANKAQTKGKIERYWRFVQRDFVRENIDVGTIEELDRRFNNWVYWYNYKHKPEFLNGQTRAEVYVPSERRAEKTDIRQMLIIEESRRVRTDSTISLYGQIYKIPRGYIGCKIWVKVRGNKLSFESMGKEVWKTRLKFRS